MIVKYVEADQRSWMKIDYWDFDSLYELISKIA
jgi:hypothetical protein